MVMNVNLEARVFHVGRVIYDCGIAVCARFADGTRFLGNNTFTYLCVLYLKSLKKNILSHSSSRSLKQMKGNLKRKELIL